MGANLMKDLKCENIKKKKTTNTEQRENAEKTHSLDSFEWFQPRVSQLDNYRTFFQSLLLDDDDVDSELAD
jgi:hypothetical protein